MQKLLCCEHGRMQAQYAEEADSAPAGRGTVAVKALSPSPLVARPCRRRPRSSLTSPRTVEGVADVVVPAEPRVEPAVLVARRVGRTRLTVEEVSPDEPLRAEEWRTLGGQIIRPEGEKRRCCCLTGDDTLQLPRRRTVDVGVEGGREETAPARLRELSRAHALGRGGRGGDARHCAQQGCDHHETTHFRIDLLKSWFALRRSAAHIRHFFLMIRRPPSATSQRQGQTTYLCGSCLSSSRVSLDWVTASTTRLKDRNASAAQGAAARWGRWRAPTG